MLVKQDSCRLNNTQSFLYKVSCNVDIVECIILIGKGIPPNKHHANFVFALNKHLVNIQVITTMSQKGPFLNDG